MADVLNELAEASREAEEAKQHRDALIRAAREQGHTIRAIADAASLSLGGVHKILRRDQ